METVAIVGMGCRFPGAPNVSSFWDLLSRKGDAITEVPPDRYDVDAFYDPKPATRGKAMSRYGGFLDQIDQFDADFFGISPREAAKMDPQHRLLMEVAWEAMEDAGLVPTLMSEAERANIASFVGLITSDYGDYQLRNLPDLDVYSSAGSARAAGAGRVSYALDLMGTSFILDAACSSSLICIDQAVQSLRSGAHTTVLAGGVNIIASPTLTIAFSQGGMMAPDGKCKSFDARGNGYVRSEGVGIVVLKLLSRALADGDRIHAVIRGSACSNDGQCESFMAPSTRGQQLGLRKALRNANVDPLSIDYVEAHGPGTRAGDPVEITTLGEVLCQQREQPLLVGSVKSNIGHTEGAAGIAGLVKTVLCLQHGVIAPNLHFETPNPAIPWDKYAVKIPTELTPWAKQSTPRRAVVCSYGISGTNSYVVLEEAPQAVVRQEPATSSRLLPLSARSPETLQELARRYSDYLSDPQYAEQSLHDLSYTASVRHSHHDYRHAVVGQSRQELRDQLQHYLQEPSSPMGFGERPQKIVWIFPGQGSQWIGMGRDLLEQEPVFRQTIEECDQLMRAYTDGWSVLELLQADEAHACLNEIQVIQPTLFAIEVALARLWQSWGIQPDAVVGHSMGEAAAAYIAGALSLKDAVWIICKRSQLLLRTSGKGAMAAVELTLEQATNLVADYAGRVSVAVSNSANSTVLSGDPETLHQILASLEARNIFGRLVKVDVASHSPQMDPLRNDLFQSMQQVQPLQAVVPMFSTVKAAFIEGSELDATYWVQNLREPVLFHTAIQTLLQDHYTIFMEMSPHPLLIGAIRQTIEQCEASALAVASLVRDEPGKSALLTALGKIYVYGQDISWERLFPEGGAHISLPSYPWQRKRYWNEKLYQDQNLAEPVYQSRGGHAILGTAFSSALHPETYFWTAQVSPKIFSFLAEHRVDEIPVLPGAAYTELALAVATEVFGPQSFQVEHLQLSKALFFPKESSPSILQTTLVPGSETGTMRFQLFSRQAGDNDAVWQPHAQATIRQLAQPLTVKTGQYPSLEQVRGEWALEFPAAELYQRFRNGGMQHGPLFRSVTEVWRHANQTMARLVMPADLADDLPGYQLHPALLDAVQHAIAPFFFSQSDGTFLPVSIAQVKLYRTPLPGEILWSHAQVQSEDTVARTGTVEGDITLLDEQGDVLLEISGFRLQLLDGSGTPDFLHQRLNRMLYTIEWEPQAPSSARRATSRKTWLLFDERQGVGEALATQILAQGGKCIVVTPGETFRRLEKYRYELHPSAPEGFQSLFTALADEGMHTVDGIISLWGLLAQPASEDDPAYVTPTSQEFAGVGMLHLIQAITALRQTDAPRLWVVTRGVHSIEPDDTTAALFQAPLWGLRRTVVYEHPNMQCTLIDLATKSAEGDTQNLFREIWNEHEADEVALRQDQRYVARLVRYTLPSDQKETPATSLPHTNGTSAMANNVKKKSLLEAVKRLLLRGRRSSAETNSHQETPQGTSLFRSNRTYIITGGLGGVGLRCAQWMVEQGARYVILLGRRGATEEAQASIQAMCATGAMVKAMQVDVVQATQLREVLTRIRQTFPPIAGVFHSAVTLDDGTLLQLNRKRFLGVMPPKVDGSWNLHLLTREDPLDYFVMFSSVASSLGSPGQGNYAAAGAFMDQLAYYRRQHNLPALCVNWGRWREVGQATIDNRGERMDARGFTGMKSTEGLTILGNLLRQAPPQVSVMAFRFAKWSQFFPEVKQSSFFMYLSQEEGAGENNNHEPQLTREMLLTMENDQRSQALSLYVEQQIAQVLGHPSLKLESHQPLHRLGIDSLTAVELKNRINADLGTSISPVVFLQGVPFGQLTNQIEAMME